MRILNITAQKPDSTGSGVYLSELVKAFAKAGDEQAVLAGVYAEDVVKFPDKTAFYPVLFHTEELPFAIAGMSDEMPYESTVYGQMTDEMVEQFRAAFQNAVRRAVGEFRPDLIVCHHLYFVTALVREMFPDRKVCAFCHNTDLRQLKKIPLQRAFIREQIAKLDRIFALHEEQKKEIQRLFPVSEEQITVVGTGYNADAFFMQREKREEKDRAVRLIFAGKIAEKKGVASLLRALRHIAEGEKAPELELYLAGGAGNQEECAQIVRLAEESAYPVRMLGKLSQTELAKWYNRCDVFVLPSFSEGLPLTVMEAMACGDKVVVTDLPGIRPWIQANVPDAPVWYVEAPEMEHTDEPLPESLKVFERALADAIVMCAGTPYEGCPDLGGVSWERIASRAKSVVAEETERPVGGAV